MIAKWSAIKNNKKIYFAALLILIMLASITGVTFAWFIGENKELTAAQFTAGTVKVDLVDNIDNPDVTDVNGCKLYTWQLKNMGTKSSYVRIRVDSAEVEGTGDTAWAYLEDKATPINEVTGAENWGWTNRIEYEGLTTLDLYAGAGRNDLNKGTPVGEVTVEYATSTISVHYQINSDSNYSIDEAHLWLGNEKLPKNKQGNLTAAPGRLGYRPVITNNKKSASFTLKGEDLLNKEITLPFYVAAHAADDDLTEMVQPIEIGQGCEGNWFLHEGYYYYGDPIAEKVQKMPAGEAVTFCLSVCLPDKIDYGFEIKIEAVQSTNNAIEAIGWPQEVW